jgi:hypothetical protein
MQNAHVHTIAKNLQCSTSSSPVPFGIIFNFVIYIFSPHVAEPHHFYAVAAPIEKNICSSDGSGSYPIYNRY